jgi:hypothetical protein
MGPAGTVWPAEVVPLYLHDGIETGTVVQVFDDAMWPVARREGG